MQRIGFIVLPGFQMLSVSSLSSSTRKLEIASGL